VEGPQGEATIRARALVNAAGPWVQDVLSCVRGVTLNARVRHVKGSHIVVPRVHPQPHAYILQNADQRIVFVIPWLDQYSLIGTTDVPVDDYDDPPIGDAEIAYLLDLANDYLARPLARDDIVWTYSGVRPLYDDGSTDPSAVTRDYVLKCDALPGPPGPERAPVLSIFGGKITTYRKLAEQALAELAPFFADMSVPWTRDATLPGGDLPGGRDALLADLRARYALPKDVLKGIAHRHGSQAMPLLSGVRSAQDLGEDFGGGLTEREVAWLVEREWARSADDVLWRRTKCGLAMTAAQRARVAQRMAAQVTA
jgi:glycerol-3-phosphate dehydrogenase